MAVRPRRTARRPAVLDPDRPHRRPRLVASRGARTPATHSSACRRPATLRTAPHQLRHAHAVEMAREGVPLIVIQRQLGHTNLGITSIYLQGIDSAEIIDAVQRPPPA